MKFRLSINGKAAEIDTEPDTPLLWVLREEMQLTGTRFCCGAALCGACTVHIDGVAARACVTTIDSIGERKITTIEGLGGDHPVQKAWVKLNTPQCGYCQSGQVMAAAALLKVQNSPSDQDIDLAMSGNICRCGTYPRIRKAIKEAAKEMRQSSESK